ncbi:hypothetical protein HDU67_005409, partial [Dinochytrium kinnereticum]
MRRSRVPISSENAITVMNAHASLGNWHEVVGLFSEWNEQPRDSGFPSSLPRSVVKAYSKLGQFKEAARIVKSVELSDKEMAELLYGILIPSYIKGRDLNSAMRCMKRMRERGLRPSPRVYAYLSAGFADYKEKPALASLKSEMFSSGIDPESNEDFLLNTVTARSALRNPPSALEALYKLKKVSADSKKLLIAYSSVIDSKLKDGISRGSSQTFLDTNSLMEEMREHGIQPNVQTFTSFLHAYYKVGGLGRLLECFEAMEASLVKPDQHVYNILIRAYTLANKPELAVSTYKKMLEEGLPPNIRVLTSTIAAMAVVGDVGRMREIFEDAEISGAQVDHALFHVMMNGHANLKDITSCLE